MVDNTGSNDNPFNDPSAVMAGILITNMRIYDCLMALLLSENVEIYNKVYELHATGGIMTPMPSFNPEELL